MKVAEHHLAGEDVMAFLDSELSGHDSQLASVHLDECAACADLAASLRATSQQLAHWKVPPAPFDSERFAVASAGRNAITAPNPRRRFSTWAWWLMGAGAAAAVFLVFIHSPQRPAMNAMSYTPSALPAPPPMQLSERKARNGYASAVRAQLSSSNDQAQHPDASDAFAPLIARTVSLALTVKDVDHSRSSLDAILARHHGYAAQLNGSTENGPRTFQASLRIPAADLTAALQELKTLGRLTSESQSAEDITQQHQDLAARLKTARETEERFQSILQQRTGNVADVLAVEEGIARVRGEIETMESEQSALEHRVTYATIDISLTEEYKAQFDSPAGSISTRLHNSLVAGYRNARETLLGIVLFLEEFGPALLIWIAILGLPITLLWRRYRRIHSKL